MLTNHNYKPLIGLGEYLRTSLSLLCNPLDPCFIKLIANDWHHAWCCDGCMYQHVSEHLAIASQV